MLQNKRKRNNEENEAENEAITIKDNNGDKIASSSESNKNSNNSSNSNSFCFQVEEKLDSINTKNIHISEYAQFIDNIKNINSPCILKTEKYIEDFSKYINNTKNYNNKTFNAPKTFFEGLKNEDVIFLKKEYHKIPDIKNTIIFNSNLFDKVSEDDKKLFNKFHNYLTGFHNSSKISDFCFNKDIYYPFSFNDNYYKIKRKNAQGFRLHHWSICNGNIVYHFGIKGNGKSLCGRAIIYNYLHFKKLDNVEVFYPTLFINYKLFSEKINERYILLNILKYETMNLFRNLIDWNNFYKKLIGSLDNNSVFSIINQIASLFMADHKDQKFLLVIDQYSSKYDEESILDVIKNACIDNEIFNLFIIYSIKTFEDQKFFIKKLSSENFLVPEKLEKPYIEDLKYINHEISCYYKYEYRNYSCLEKNFPKEEIPNDYKVFFGDNISFFFQFKSENALEKITFEDFISKIKENIARDVIEFFDEMNYYGCKMNEILKKIIDNEGKVMVMNFELFNALNGSYFIFDKFEDKNKNYKYKYEYAFPLIRIKYEDLYKSTDVNFFINIKNPHFLELDGISMGVCFDNFMNWWFKKRAEDKIFEFSKEEIKTYNLKYLIKKNSKNITIKEMYKNEYIEKEINDSEELKQLQNQLDDDINSKKCLIIFQEFNAKSIDILFIIKKNDFWILNSLQIKCSDSFEINEQLLNENKFEMTYLRNKIKLLFGLDAKESYITYISIKEKPKKCASQNPDKFFFYNIKEDMLVNKDNKELINIPFYEGCRIPFIDEINEKKFKKLLKDF